MEGLLDAMSFKQKVASLIIFALSVAFIKLYPRFKTAVAKYEHPLPRPAILVIDGVASDKKNRLIESLQDRLESSTRSFMRVSQTDLQRMLLPTQVSNEITISDITDKGSRYISGLHKSWDALVESGNNLIIDSHFKSEEIWNDFHTAMTHQDCIVLIQQSASRAFNPLLPTRQVIHDAPDADSVARRLAMLELI